MSFQYELHVQRFLTCNGTTFVSSQYDLPFNKDLASGGSRPDFVAIRPSKKEVLIVEVTTAWDIKPLASKVAIGEAQWIRALRHTLSSSDTIDSDWHFKILVFLRANRIKPFLKATGEIDGLHVWPLEYVLEHWKWPQSVRSSDFDFSLTEIAGSVT